MSCIFCFVAWGRIRIINHDLDIPLLLHLITNYYTHNKVKLNKFLHKKDNSTCRSKAVLGYPKFQFFYLTDNQSGSKKSQPSTLWMHTNWGNSFPMKNTVLAGK